MTTATRDYEQITRDLDCGEISNDLLEYLAWHAPVELMRAVNSDGADTALEALASEWARKDLVATAQAVHDSRALRDWVARYCGERG